MLFACLSGIQPGEEDLLSKIVDLLVKFFKFLGWLPPTDSSPVLQKQAFSLDSQFSSVLVWIRCKET